MKLESKIFREMLQEELERQERLEQMYLRDLEKLPKGSIQVKKLNGKEYYYLMYRDGNSVKSNYIQGNDIDIIKEKILERRQIEKLLKQIKLDIKSMRKVVK